MNILKQLIAWWNAPTPSQVALDRQYQRTVFADPLEDYVDATALARQCAERDAWASLGVGEPVTKVTFVSES